MSTMVVKGPNSVLGRVGVVGDVHCEDALLSRLLDYFALARVDAILCVGDIADGHGDINQTCRLLAEHNVQCVAGNHDRWLLAGDLRDDPEATQMRVVSSEARAFLEALPPTREFETRAGKLLLCHGTDDDDMHAVKNDHLRFDMNSNHALQRLLKQAKHRFLVGGHTHQTMVRRVRDLTLINPGTLHRAYPQTSSVIDFETHEVEFYDLSSRKIELSEALPFPEQDELSSRVLRL